MKEIDREKNLRKMPSEELEAILMREQESNTDPDVDLIKAVLNELDRRDVMPKVDVDEAWKRFQSDYLDTLVKNKENEI